MVRVWKTKSLLFCLRYDPLIVFRRQNHITFIFIKMMSHDLLVQMAYIQPSQTYAKVGKNGSIILITSFCFVFVVFHLVWVALYNDLNLKLSHNLVYRYTIEPWEMYEFINYSHNIVLTNFLTKNMIDIQTFTAFCHLLSYKYNVSHLDDSGIKICIT